MVYLSRINADCQTIPSMLLCRRTLRAGDCCVFAGMFTGANCAAKNAGPHGNLGGAWPHGISLSARLNFPDAG